MQKAVAAASKNDLLARLHTCIQAGLACICRQQNSAGYWEGELAASPFATGLGSIALTVAAAGLPPQANRKGLHWLLERQNGDGGWGDTDISPSNPPSTIIAAAALRLGEDGSLKGRRALHRAQGYLQEVSGTFSLESYYGGDRTFADPVRAMGALAGLMDWKDSGCLPFEVILLPRRLTSAIRLPVVSFALPILVAVGILQSRSNPARNLGLRGLRQFALQKGVQLLHRLQPAHGGYLESPLCTSLVIAGLKAGGLEANYLAKSLDFLLQTQRPDGSWPIVTNLSVWNTSLALQALVEAGFSQTAPEYQRAAHWLVSQYREKLDAYSGKMSYGWSWTHSEGGLIDADDTASAIRVLAGSPVPEVADKISASLGWLTSLQNADGGWPTFSRGRGTLVFDRSCVDISSNVVNAFRQASDLPGSSEINRGVAYVRQAQVSETYWKPLWFGNELAGLRANPLYGTYKALEMLSWAGDEPGMTKPAGWIIKKQNPDGGWGQGRQGNSSPEETSFALLGLLSRPALVQKHPELLAAVEAGVEWLLACQRPDGSWDATPVGIYCEGLWYYEQMYALAYPLLALGRYRKMYV